VSARTFVVTVSDSPQRVVVEDVRSRRTAVGDDLSDVGERIADLLEAPDDAGDDPGAGRVSES
jgi:hypothetical protein